MPLPSPKCTTTSPARSKTSVRYLRPLRVLISSMAMYARFPKGGLENRLIRSRFWISLMASQPAPSKSATSRMVIFRTSAWAYRSNAVARQRLGSAILKSIRRTHEQSRHFTLGTLMVSQTDLKPLGTVLSHRSNVPRLTTRASDKPVLGLDCLTLPATKS